MVICDPQYIEKRLKGKGHWFTSTLYLLRFNDLVKFLMATVAVKSLYEWQLCHLHREDEVVKWTSALGRGGWSDFFGGCAYLTLMIIQSYCREVTTKA